jgi:hypothetical protein
MDADETDIDFTHLVFGGTGKGHVSVVDWGMNSVVLANVDDDPDFEFQLVIKDKLVKACEYTADDFVLDFV